MAPIAIAALILILTRWVAEFWLSQLNARHVRAHGAAIPEALHGVVDAATYQKSIDYTLAKSRFSDINDTYDTVILLAVLFSGVLPWAFGAFVARVGQSVWAVGAFLFAGGVTLGALSLPFEWYAQFQLEERFGFNMTSVTTWILDRVKGLLLAALLGFPLLALVLKVIVWTGANWWLWAWAIVVAFQMLMMLIAPALIMPLFNKFTPLAEGSLRDRLFALARRTGFPTRSIDVMDGSKRSRHSNAFFAGFGRLRRIVLFDTLVSQLSEPELEAVLAHEIGHYKKRHILKLMCVSVFSLFVALATIAWLARQAWFYQAFGFEAKSNYTPAGIVPALILFGLLAGTVSFWIGPILNIWSRRFEYQADAFAREVMSEAQPLIGALRKLNEKNLSNLMPHPLYSGFYYSHPTLLERERALLTPGV